MAVVTKPTALMLASTVPSWDCTLATSNLAACCGAILKLFLVQRFLEASLSQTKNGSRVHSEKLR